MDIKDKGTTKIEELEIRLKQIDNDLSKGYSTGRRAAGIKLEEKLGLAKSDLYLDLYFCD